MHRYTITAFKAVPNRTSSLSNLFAFLSFLFDFLIFFFYARYATERNP